MDTLKQLDTFLTDAAQTVGLAKSLLEKHKEELVQYKSVKLGDSTEQEKIHRRKVISYERIPDDGTWAGHVVALFSGIVCGVLTPFLLCCFPRLCGLSDNQIITLAGAVMVGIVFDCLIVLHLIGTF